MADPVRLLSTQELDAIEKTASEAWHHTHISSDVPELLAIARWASEAHALLFDLTERDTEITATMSIRRLRALLARVVGEAPQHE